MVEHVVGAIISAFTGLGVWWLIERAPLPNLHVGRNISVLPERRRAHAWRYRIKVANVRRWPLRHRPVIDLRLVATLQIRGLDSDAPLNWNNYTVPIANSGVSALMVHNSIVELRTFDMDLDDRPILASHVRPHDLESLDLRRLLALGTESKLRLLITASNSYTHATTTEVVHFGADDFVVGRFSRRPGRAGLKVVPRRIESPRPARAGPPEESTLDAIGSAWHHQNHMASMIQIRNVPEELHRDLKIRAARSGMTLSDYLLAELRALAVRPTMREWLDRTATWEPVEVEEPPAEALAAERSRRVA